MRAGYVGCRLGRSVPPASLSSGVRHNGRKDSVLRSFSAYIVRQCVLAVAAIGAMLPTGCIPLHTSSHVLPASSPAVFCDAKTGSTLGQVLVIPRYGSSSGISTMIGEGPGAMSHDAWLADPFIYRNGQAFILKQPKATGVMFGPGWLWIGTSKNLHQVFAIAPRYRGAWVDLVSDKSVTSSLERISPADSKLEIAALHAALLETKRWHNSVVKFDSGDTRLVVSRLDQWLEDLNANAHEAANPE